MDHGLHGGDIYGSEIIHDFSVNVNPLGLPEGVGQALRESVGGWWRYPDPQCRGLVRKLAAYHHVAQERLVCGNGAADLLYRFAQMRKPRQALTPVPTFSEYERAVRAAGGETRYYGLREGQGYRLDVDRLIGSLEGAEVLFLCNPNNPTGLALPKGQVEKLAKACGQKGVFLVLDECFCDFLQDPEEFSFLGNIGKYPGVMVLRAFTKTYAMAGLRLGYAVCGDPGLAQRLQQAGQPWSVSLPAQEAGVAALDEKGYLARTRELVERERRRLGEGLKRLGFKVFPSQVNFLLFQDNKGAYGDLWARCREGKILIRDCCNFPGLGPPGRATGHKAGEGGPWKASGYYRICVRKEEENQYLLRWLAQL